MQRVLQRRWCSGYTYRSVKTLLETKPVDQAVLVQGWAKAIRRMKKSVFLDLNDGSTPDKLQVVVPHKVPPELMYHSGVRVRGVLRTSSHPKQEVELHADHVQVVGRVTGDAAYPFAIRGAHSTDYVRQFMHVRARTNSFASTMRLRALTRAAMSGHLSDAGYVHVDAPVLSGNECEGGGDVFYVVTEAEKSNPEEKFFGSDAFLSVSGQLHLEALANGLSRVFTFNPAFRAEASLGRRHLAEFWMVEAEEAFLEGEEGLQTLLERVEGLAQTSLSRVLGSGQQDLVQHWQLAGGEREATVRAAACAPYARLRFSDALQLLRDAGCPVHGDKSLTRDNELTLTRLVGGPVFVTHWPAHLKPFYMARSSDDTVLCFDLLLPEVGEVAGGSVREPCPLQLRARSPPSQQLQWYVQLREWGGVPTAGYGLGFERLLLFLTGVQNIRDVIPFPRWPLHCPH